MLQNESFLERLERKRDTLSKSQKKLADYIRVNYRSVVFLSCVPLAKAVGVSEATVVRFANALGYKGFTDMINHMQDYIKQEITTVDKFEKYETIYNHSNVFREVINRNVKLIERLPSLISEETIERIISDLNKHKKVFLMGFESAAGPMEYFAYHLVRMGLNVETITEKHPNLFNVVNETNEETFVICISFPRYAKEQTWLSSYLKQKGARICLLTDKPKCPIYEFCDYSVLFPLSEDFSISANVYVAILTLFQIIIIEYSLHNYDNVHKSLENLEEFNKALDIF